MFIAVLFVIAPNWQQTKCPSTDEWEKQVLSIYIMNCFSGKKKKKWFSDNTIWINLKNNYVDTNNKCWRGSGEEGTLLYYWSGCKLMQPLWKTIWSCLRKLKGGHWLNHQCSLYLWARLGMANTTWNYQLPSPMVLYVSIGKCTSKGPRVLKFKVRVLTVDFL